jgi:prefoldin subunit 5
MLATVAAIGISGISAANAKESTCDVTAGGKCIIVAKRGDVEIDKLTIVVGSGGGVATNLTDINNAISVIQGQIASQSDQIGTVNSQLNTLSAQVANFSDTGITSIEIAPVNETVPVPPVVNDTGGNVTDTNSTG